MEENYQIETKCIQSGWKPTKGEPRVLPIYQSTTFKYDTSDQMGRLFDLEEAGYFYTRLQNPTNDAVAAKIADLEGGIAAMLTSSGQAANYFAVFNICEAGDHIVASSSLYGGTFNLLGTTLKKQGISCTFVDPDASEEELSAAFLPNTKAVIAETLSNPSLVVLDIEKFAHVAHAHGVPLIVDNTFATPINCRPFEWGADIVTHSTTKYMDGHAMAVGGCIVDSGNFDWEKYKDKYPGLTQPDESYHGIVYTQKFGKLAYIEKATAQLMRDLGSIPSPMNSFLLNVGLETLHLRVPRHCENAISGGSYKPGDIIGSMAGKTIEVLNTDAEGRLTLIDAVTYIIEKENINKIVDVATLTGAALVALGTEITGVISNNDEFYDELITASKRSGEKFWRLPNDKCYKKLYKGDFTDFKNIGGRYGGCITAGMFIGEFVQDKPWLHLDIAGTSWVESSSDTTPKGGTGAPVATLYELVVKHKCKHK